MAQLIPCRNPKLCGVKNHYPNTASKCSATKIAQGPLAAPPPLVPNLARDEEIPSKHLDGIPAELRESFLSERPRTALIDIEWDFGDVEESYEREDGEEGMITLTLHKWAPSFALVSTRKTGRRSVMSRNPEDGPAFATYGKNGVKNFEEYLLDGRLCPRPDGGPSRTQFDRETGEPISQMWVNERGFPHRLNGPAIVNSGEADSYFLDGEKYDSKDEYERALQNYDRRG